MSYSAFLSSILRLFGANPEQHLDGVVEDVSDGTLQPASGPMSDQELSRAIKELRDLPVAKGTLDGEG